MTAVARSRRLLTPPLESSGDVEKDLSIQTTDLPLSAPTTAALHLESQAILETHDEQDHELLISSPYTEIEHRLRLSTLDQQSVLLARALQYLDPTTPDYAITPYRQGLNWDTLLAKLRELCLEAKHTWRPQSFYVVAFFSRLKPNIDRDLLGQLDKNSHEEAAISGGLLKYWFGSPSADRRNLATCVWRDEADARAGGKGPGHANAMRATKSLYERIDFKTMSLTVNEGAQDLSIEIIQEKAFDYANTT